ncbi:MAG: rhamnan synthesis F family protein [Dissulfuribacterales bacterium]
MEALLMPYAAIEYIPARSVLVLAPHPDDEVFGCGGALACSVKHDIPSQVIIVSDGAYGTQNPSERSKLIAIRQEESRKAAAILGYGEPQFWDYEDRAICYCEELIVRIEDAIKKTGADLIYIPSILEMHPDHRSLAMSALEAVRRLNAEIRVAMYEVGMPMRPNTLVNITPVWGLKQQAMACFQSQLKIQDYHDHITGLNRYRTYTLGKTITYAEAYCLIESARFDEDFLGIYASEYKKQTEISLPVPLIGPDMPKVSVLVRSMDRPELKEALDSISLQTYPNIEVIVVNARGKGHSALPDRCGRFPLIFVDSDTQLRRSRAANIALKHAGGDFLIFLDDDDMFLPNHIHTLVTTLKAKPAYKAAYTGIQGIDSVRNKLKQLFITPFDSILLLAGNYIPIHAAMFSRELLGAGCKMDEAFDLYEDWDFWIQASQHTDFLFIPKITACYRITEISGAGIRSDNPKRQEAEQRIFRKWKTLWSDEVLDYVLARIGSQHINPWLIQMAREHLTARHQSSYPPGIAVVLHLFYEDLWPEIRTYLQNIPFPFDLFITFPLEKASKLEPLIRNDYPDARLRPLENRGRDILPFLTILPELIQKNYTCVCKIHTKKSHEAVNGPAWRKDILNSLLGNRAIIEDIVKCFQAYSELGILGPKMHCISCSIYPDANITRLLDIAERLCPGASQRDWNFFAGSMFWFRPAAMLPLLKLGIKLTDFEKEAGQKEGTLAHTIERLFPLSAEAAGLSVQTVEDGQRAATHQYPFAPKSIFDIIQEKNRLQVQVQKTEAALKTAEELATDRLETIKILNRQLKQTEDALNYAERLVEERSNLLQEIQNALKYAEKLAIERLKQLQEIQNAYNNAEALAIERLNTIEKLQIELQNIKQHTIWKICTKLNIIKNNP